MKRILLLIIALPLFSVTAASQSRVEEMNSEQIRNLSKEKTGVLIPGGILEQHGPYLPSFTDGYWNEWLTSDLNSATR